MIPSFAALFVPPALADHDAVIDVQQLGELLIAEGLLTVEQAERFLGADLDDDDEWWESDGDMAAAGENPQLRNALKEQERAEQAAKQKKDDEEYTRTGKYPSPEPQDPAMTARGRYQALTEKLTKAVNSTAPHKYISKVAGPSGKPVYKYAMSTGTGENARSDNAPQGKSTGNPAGQLHKHGGSTAKHAFVQGQSYAVRFGGKKKSVRPKNDKEAKGLSRLAQAKKVTTE